MSRRALPSLLLSSLLLTACPLGRQKSVDCGGVTSHVETADKALAPFKSVDPKTATKEQLDAWSAAASAADKAFPAYDELVHDDVKQAAKQYKTALAGLSSAVSDRASGKGAPDGAAVSAAVAALETARQNLDKACPAGMK